ncbi:MAG: matrixin family metalloprotease [Vampirovibrionales bacterium]|nr:matrixin family metalloprotease [Vampirovibrionales bacterium]
MAPLIVLLLLSVSLLTPAFSWANPAATVSNPPVEGTPYEVPQPKGSTEITRYNQFVSAFNQGITFKKANQLEQALVSYEKAYAAWPCLDAAEAILGVLHASEQWDRLSQRIQQFPQTVAYQPLRNFYSASWVEEQGRIAFKTQQWALALQQWQLAEQQLQPLQTDSHFGPRVQQWQEALQHNIQAAQNNQVSSSKREQFIKETLEQENKGLYFTGLGERRRIDFVWNTAYLPLRIYAKPRDSIDGYDPQWQPLIQQALNEWQQKSEGLITFTMVPTEDLSDITIRWIASLNEADKSNEEPQKIGLTSTRFLGDSILTADIDVATHLPTGEKPSSDSIYATLLHEVGHALGLGHHSANSNDVMSPIQTARNNAIEQGLSLGDLTMLKSQYGSPAPHVVLANRSSAPRSDRLWAQEQLVLASNLMKKNKFKKAMVLLQKTDALLPNMPAVQLPLMVCYVQRKKTKPLEALVSHWQTQEPNSPMTAMAQGYLEERLAHKAFSMWEWKKAIAHFSTAIIYFDRVPKTSVYSEQARSSASIARRNIAIAQYNGR